MFDPETVVTPKIIDRLPWFRFYVVHYDPCTDGTDSSCRRTKRKWWQCIGHLRIAVRGHYIWPRKYFGINIWSGKHWSKK